jgi:hypothetical protein
MSADYQGAINAIAKATADFYAALPEYLEARKEGEEAGRTPITISADLRERLLACSDTLEAANGFLSKALTD